MKVFALKFLEPMQIDETVDQQGWVWRPVSENPVRIYGSGNNTKTRSSTYAAETDNRQDDDRPNEGLAA